MSTRDGEIRNSDKQIDEYRIEIQSLQDANRELRGMVHELQSSNRELRGTIHELAHANEGFRQSLADKRELIVEQGKLIEAQGAKLQELEKRFKLNSSNSHKPPSSDFGKKRKEPKRTKSLRGKSSRKSGGQKGHPGKTLQRVSQPDHVEVHPVQTCPCCQGDLSSQEVEGYQSRQVFDIPKPRIEVTEHRVEVKTCLCGRKCVGDFPADVTAPVQYGVRLKTLGLYFKNQQLIPEKRVAEILEDAFHVPVAASSVALWETQLSESVGTWVEHEEEKLAQSPVKHLDETGLRVQKKGFWLHVMCSSQTTIYRVRAKRGDMFPNLSGTLIHDCFPSYDALQGVQHGLCGAHLLRELQALTELEKEDWAKSMLRLLLKAHESREEGQAQRIPVIAMLYDRIVSRGLAYHESLNPLTTPKRGRMKRRKGHNLALRLKDRKGDVLRFLKDSQVPFTNNQAERDLRMMKVKMKISGCFRSLPGAQKFCLIRSFTSTCKKHGLNIFQSLNAAFQGALPYFNDPPSPCPA